VIRLVIDPGSAAPPYEQVRAQLAALARDGTLPAGARLPTVRGLAAELGLAVNTVARAYRELEESGLVETRGRAGTFVTAAGDGSRRRVQRAAREYADTALGMGLDPEEALGIVAAALRNARGRPAVAVELETEAQTARSTAH
jgi:DNA-binding transcriptional regulator YhcF (GntR family)